MARTRTKTRKDARRFVTMVAEHHGWKLNPDARFLEDLIEGLRDNYNRYGYFLCPCRESWEDRSRDEDVICPCRYCVPDQREYGHCYCALYLTEEFHRSGRTPGPIPERRPPELIP